MGGCSVKLPYFDCHYNGTFFDYCPFDKVGNQTCYYDSNIVDRCSYVFEDSIRTDYYKEIFSLIILISTSFSLATMFIFGMVFFLRCLIEDTYTDEDLVNEMNEMDEFNSLENNNV